MTYTPMLIVHIIGGMVGVLSGFAALFVRKGSPLHRRTGDVFVVAMLIMGASGAYRAIAKSQPFNVLAGTLTCYLVATAWLTVQRKAGETGRLEYGLLGMGVLTGVISCVLGARSGSAAYFVFATIAFLLVAGDVRMLMRGGVSGPKRLLRHLWRMCFALFVAAGSFFLGAADPNGLRNTLFTKQVRATHINQVPVLILVLMTIYWLVRVRFSKVYRKVES
jgi:uncharacterized membrane protein